MKPRTKKFTHAPEGVHTALLVDIVDLGLDEEGAYGPRYRLELVFQLDELDPEHELERHTISQRYTDTLNEKSMLAPVVEALLQRALTNKERYELDYESLIGRCCQVEVTHRETSKGGLFARVEKALPLAKGQEPLLPDGYVRRASAVKGTAPF